ncbi:MAG: pirin family protein [Cyclobacteriaceae bacterium]|jgi:redox-sensitive bicupin YhaK (pirin superfamily)|nr:pirin family protein [Flammeovirgaceae bacterium]MCZ8022939.1 pirin family protein [Cytophagales bacterium]MCZ8327315.1 pirin family protein [Cyclobacteriaceae bacterium]
MKFVLTKPEDRGTKEQDWLVSKFSFAFSTYQDPTRQGFGQLKAFNDDVLKVGKGFGTHPHDNMEIISVLLKGNMNHQDSMGYKNEVGPYDVQIMSAGLGLHHSEYNIGTEDVNFLQIWINPRIKNTQPSYRAMAFPLDERKNKLKKIIGPERTAEHLHINQDANLYLGHAQTGHVLQHEFTAKNRCAFLFMIEGEATVNEQRIEKRYSIGLWETSSLTIASKTDCEFVLIEVPINQ